MRRSKAQVTVDMAVGMIIFVSMVAVAFYYISYISKPKQPFEATLQAQGYEIADELNKNVTWTVYRSPVWMTATNSSLWNYELRFRPDAAVDQKSIAILDSGRKEVPSGFAENSVIWVSNATAGSNRFYLVYTKNTTLPAIIYATDLNSSATSANNSAIKAGFNSAGISSIIFGGTEMLGNGINLGTSSLPANITLAVRAKFSYPDGVSAKVYSNLSKIAISSNHSINPVLYLQTGFTNFYNGSEYAFSGPGQQFNSILNHTDVYSASSGVAVIGNNLNISVYNTTYREIRIYNATDFEIYIHSGNYANSLAERDLYLNVRPIMLGVPNEMSGVSLENLAVLASLPYPVVRSKFKSTNFNLSVENTSAGVGTKIPNDRDVMVVNKPAAIIGRLGNITETYFNVAVWLGSDYA